jgi:hypothetical protein
MIETTFRHISTVLSSRRRADSGRDGLAKLIELLKLPEAATIPVGGMVVGNLRLSGQRCKTEDGSQAESFEEAANDAIMDKLHNRMVSEETVHEEIIEADMFRARPRLCREPQVG